MSGSINTSPEMSNGGQLQCSEDITITKHLANLANSLLQVALASKQSTECHVPFPIENSDSFFDAHYMINIKLCFSQ